ncbi:MAG: replicative DNA helicase [Proteobacteria bacterium]|nr:replicative DNA helicase [Pseudomonadota bacterium]
MSSTAANTAVVETAQNENALKHAPNNLEAEQALIGAFIVNNENIHKVSDFLYPSHFYAPLHARIYGTILRFIEKGMVATPITLKQYLENEESLSEQGIGGFEYLVRLVSNSATVVNIESLAREIHSHAVRRRLIEIGEDIVNDAYEKLVEVEPMQQVEKAESRLFQLACEGETRDNVMTLKQSVNEVLRRIDEAKRHGTDIVGVDTGFFNMNDLLGGGLQKSDLVIIAARPSMGKTSLAINMAVNAARSFFNKTAPGENKSVGFFSLEMSSEQIASRIISLSTGIESSKIRTGKVGHDDFIKISNHMSDINSLPFYVDDTPMLSISALRTKARRLSRQNNLGLIIVDYLQLMRGSSHYDSGGRVLEVGEITNGLKAIAKELEIPVVALSQLSRAVESREDKRPQLSDLRESGNIEQDADVVMFIYRPEYYLMRKIPLGEEQFVEWQREMDAVKNIAEVIIAKHRNGPIGTVPLFFNSNTTSFNNLDSVHEGG